MAKRSLLLGFDAFGTLFRIKQPIERQYGDVARHQFGLLKASTDDELRTAFRAAFKAQSRAHPNYGRTSGMGATVWWTQVIHKSFQPLLRPDETIPADLAPQLLARFASREGYAMDPALPSLLRALKEQQSFYDRIVVGVITNSDDRVPDILSSFGLRVSPLRFGGTTPPSSTDSYDIDFHCMSYDVGAEKPDPFIFRAAESLLPVVVGAQGETELNLDNWDKVYVGDEAQKDVSGAQAAGWHPVLLAEKDADALNGLLRLEDCRPQPFGQLFGSQSDNVVVGVDSVASFVQWMLGTGVLRGRA
ncbi:hypothetical protein SEUCBS139899_005863 [Sporothrix eucalyptigena]|uniref:Haloacid dehalogenase n=1 Tax=Sporothrix eucalyptigena TaxID=1812306 RepID=A0ABP0D180_9PEZI